MDRQPKYRKHVRLKGFDYSSGHYYFVTLCTKGRKELFEPRVSEKYGHELPDFVTGVAATHASPDVDAGEIKRVTDTTEQCLLSIPEHFPNAEIDFYVFMPNHIHLVLVINDARPTEPVRGAACRAATKRTTLGNIIGSFKSAASRLSGKSLWQPNYYEHIVRSEEALDKIRTYILRNPWIEYDEINWKRIDPS